MIKKISLIGVAVVLAACATTTNTTKTEPYAGNVEQSALVYGLPQTRLYFETELTRTYIKRGPYAEYATRMLGLQDVPMKDVETWRIEHIRISSKEEVDNEHLYTLSFLSYPQNLNHLLRFTREGLILDVSADNVISSSSVSGKNPDDVRFTATALSSMFTEKVDTFYKLVETDTDFVKIPILQRVALGKTKEEQAREVANQIFDLRDRRIKAITGDTDYHYPDGEAMKAILAAFDAQENQLLSLFAGAKVESQHVYTYSLLPEEPGSAVPLFYFSERSGIAAPNTVGAKAVWYRIGAKALSPTNSLPPDNVVYYRIPQVAEITVGLGNQIITSRQKSIYQFGRIVAFPLIAPVVR